MDDIFSGFCLIFLSAFPCIYHEDSGQATSEQNESTLSTIHQARKGRLAPDLPASSPYATDVRLNMKLYISRRAIDPFH